MACFDAEVVCGPCNRSQGNLLKLKTKHGELVTEWLKMSPKSWDEFVEHNKHLTTAGMAAAMKTEITQIKQQIQEQEDLRRGSWMCKTQMQKEGYSEEHIKSIVANCKYQWDPEISELCFFLVALEHT